MKKNLILVLSFIFILVGILSFGNSALAGYTAAQINNYVANHPAVVQAYVATHPAAAAVVKAAASAPAPASTPAANHGGVAAAASCASPKCSYGGTCYNQGTTFAGYTCSGGSITAITASPASAASCASPKCFWNNGCYGDGTIVSLSGVSYRCSGGSVSQVSAGGSCSAPNCRYSSGVCASNGGNTIYGGICYKCSNTAINAVSMSNCTGGGGGEVGVASPGTVGYDPGHVTPPPGGLCSYIYQVTGWSTCTGGQSHAIGVNYRVSANSADCHSVATTRSCGGPNPPGPDPDPSHGGGGVHGGSGTVTNGVCGSSADNLFYSVPNSNLCNYSSVTPTISGNGSVLHPWAWFCVGSGSGASSPSCVAYLNTVDPDPALKCAQLAIMPSSTININTNAVFTFTPDSPNIYWKTEGDTDFVARANPMNKIFTTIGQKTIIAKVASTAPSVFGTPCEVDINVVQTGGGTNEF